MMAAGTTTGEGRVRAMGAEGRAEAAVVVEVAAAVEAWVMGVEVTE